jgi:hypothetical protein
MEVHKMPNDEKENSFKILYQEQEGYLHAIISGQEDSLAVSLEYWRRVIAECNKRSFKKLLVEENFPNQLSVTDIFEITSTIPGMGSKGLKIAFVDQESLRSELNLFGETVAKNRGVYGRVFQTRAEAIAWLRL